MFFNPKSRETKPGSNWRVWPSYKGMDPCSSARLGGTVDPWTLARRAKSGAKDWRLKLAYITWPQSPYGRQIGVEPKLVSFILVLKLTYNTLIRFQEVSFMVAYQHDKRKREDIYQSPAPERLVMLASLLAGRWTNIPLDNFCKNIVTQFCYT